MEFHDGRGPKALVTITTPMDTLTMHRDRAGTMLSEWKMWMDLYRMKGFDYAGKTVIDAGSGEGETVAFYRMLGVTKFICVEIDPDRNHIFKYNMKMNSWSGITLYEEAFSERFLTMQADFLKSDVEGGEACLIGHEIPIPAVVETHGPAITEAFEKMGFQVLRRTPATRSAIVSRRPFKSQGD